MIIFSYYCIIIYFEYKNTFSQFDEIWKSYLRKKLIIWLNKKINPFQEARAVSFQYPTPFYPTTRVIGKNPRRTKSHVGKNPMRKKSQRIKSHEDKIPEDKIPCRKISQEDKIPQGKKSHKEIFHCFGFFGIYS